MKCKFRTLIFFLLSYINSFALHIGDDDWDFVDYESSPLSTLIIFIVVIVLVLLLFLGAKISDYCRKISEKNKQKRIEREQRYKTEIEEKVKELRRKQRVGLTIEESIYYFKQQNLWARQKEEEHEKWEIITERPKFIFNTEKPSKG